ncbi:MAG: LysM peptidoglycan-binding domain-containing M23 family metallopeptidase [Myxococcales bacterium]|nr:LysM peptidoglycan-binding domain-containing M23 family metallopeptidase [Myxococcales bacterium]
MLLRPALLAGTVFGGALGCAGPSALVRAEAPFPHQEPELVTAPMEGGRQHRVEKGESLYAIARIHGISAEELAEANGIADPRRLTAGRLLWVPVRPVRRGANPPKASAESGSRGGAALDWPLRGVLYGRFGKKGREPHDGIDLAAPLGTPVRTAAEGTVLFAGEQRGYGLIAIIEHPIGLVTLYAHNKDLRVKAGQQVRREQVIATVGESGRTSGPHLHFEVRKGGLPVDPLPLLEGPGKRQARRRISLR